MYRPATHARRKATLRITQVALVVALTGAIAGGSVHDAHAQSGAFCSTVERLSNAGLMYATIEASDSINTAIAKTTKIRNSWITIRKVSPPDLQGDMTRMINNLATINKNLALLKTQRGTKAAGTRVFVQQMIGNFQSDTLFLKLSIDELCGGGGSVDDDLESGDIPPVPAPSASAGRSVPGSGVYEVDVDIARGSYTTRGSVSCRAGQSDDITGTDITQGYVASIGSGVTTIVIDGSRRYFITRNCPDWRPGLKP